jgi:hypothetical protein
VSEAPDQGRPTAFRIDISPDVSAGRYANFLAVWHTRHELTLDFATTGPAEEPEGASGPLVVPCQVVARIKVSPSVVFDMLRALSDNLAGYEERFGPIAPGGNGDNEEQT